MGNLAYIHNGNHAAATIAANVRAEIGRAGIHDADLAAAIGITAMAMSRRLKDHVAFTVSEVQSIADYSGIAPGDLFTDQPRDRPNHRTLVPKVAGSTPVGGTLLPFPGSRPRPAVERPRLAPVYSLRGERVA